MKTVDRINYIPKMHKSEEFKRFGTFIALPTEERKEVFGFSTEKEFERRIRKINKALRNREGV
jgi:hypothetical protein